MNHLRLRIIILATGCAYAVIGTVLSLKPPLYLAPLIIAFIALEIWAVLPIADAAGAYCREKTYHRLTGKSFPEQP
jgi:hypothetical protein